jgi:WXG100 family type VII secretion target
MGEVKVTFGEIANAQSNVSQTSTQINQLLDDLKAYLTPMVATWDGAASEAYNEKQRQWDTSAGELNQVLAQIGAALGTANQNYQDAERRNTGLWS